MKQLIKQYLGFIILSTISFNLLAIDPKTNLEDVTAKISKEITANKDKIKADSNYAKSLIGDYLLPQVDTTYMAKRILGKTYWQQATKQQQETFIEQFIGLMLNTYSKGLANYNGQLIRYNKTQYSKSGKTANVRSIIETGDGEPILIDYRLKRQANDDWLITDVIIEGVSMAKSFASQYREQIKQIGLDGMLEQLAAENKQAAEVTKITDS